MTCVPGVSEILQLVRLVWKGCFVLIAESVPLEHLLSWDWLDQAWLLLLQSVSFLPERAVFVAYPQFEAADACEDWLFDAGNLS